MSRLSEKIKIIYLTLVILFSLGVFVYLLDTWHIIRLKDHIPYLKNEPPVVGEEADDAGLRKEEQLQKEEQRLQEMEQRLKEAEAKLSEQSGNVQKQQEEIELMRKGLAEERKKLEEQKQLAFQRQKTVKEMSGRLLNMPPDDAVAICANWSNADVVDVFLQMERDAEAEGRQSIVPFLLTKLPRERAGILTTMMMDERARQTPESADGPPAETPAPQPPPGQ